MRSPEEVGVDPLELRRRNFIRPEQFPYEAFTGLVYDSGDHDKAATIAADLIDYDGVRARQATQNVEGSTKRLGLGVSSYFEMCGLAPSRVLASLNYSAGGWEAATVRILPTAKVQVVTGTSPHGQGHETAWSMIVADKLGIDPADVDVLHSDTAIAPLGMDTYGSRSLPVGGVAVGMACDKVIEKAKQIAAHQMEANVDDLEFVDGEFRVAGTPSKSTPLAAIAFAAFTAHDLPDGLEPNLEAQVTYDPPNFSWPFGTHMCLVEVDTETGDVDVLQYVAVDDCGNQVNPLIVEGQVHGGVIQGLAQALYEGADYDSDGNLRTSTLADYLVPAASDVPPITLGHSVTPSPTNSLGVKGVGEAGTIGSAPAVMNAIVDALSGLGVRDVPMPASPNTVWNAIASASTPLRPNSQQPRRHPVIPAPFDYVRAESAEEAISLVGQHGDEAKFIAGGHSLLPMMKLRLAQPSVLIDIGRLSDLSYIREEGDQIAIGAMTRHMDVETSDAAQGARAAAGPRRRPRRRPAGAPPRHARRHDRARRPGVRSPGHHAGARRHLRGPGPERHPRDRCERLLPHVLRVGARARRDPHRGARPQDERRRLELPEVQPSRPGLGDRRRCRVAQRRPGRRRTGQHGRHSGARHQRGRCDRQRGQRRRRRRAGCRRRRPAGRPERQHRVPPAPRSGPHPPGPRRRLVLTTYTTCLARRVRELTRRCSSGRRTL